MFGFSLRDGISKRIDLDHRLTQSKMGTRQEMFLEVKEVASVILTHHQWSVDVYKNIGPAPYTQFASQHGKGPLFVSVLSVVQINTHTHTTYTISTLIYLAFTAIYTDPT